MKMLHYTFLLPIGAFGGMEIQMVKRAADAILRGESSLFVGQPASRTVRFAASLGIPVESIRVRVDYVDLVAAWRLGKILKARDSNICVVGASKHLSLAVLARKLVLPDLAVVFYQQLHGSRKKRDPFHDWVYRNLDGAIVLTKKLKLSLVDRTVLPGEKIEVVPYGVDVEAFDPVKHNKREDRRKFDLPEEGLLVGLVGRIEEAKGQAVAIEAFAKAGIPDSMLVICGAEQQKGYLDRLREQARELRIEQSVRFLPFTTEIPSLMNAFDISLLPSRGETFGLVVIEAMAAGIPVIGTDAEGVPEIIDHQRNGILVPPGESDALAGAMRLLAEDDGLRERLGRQARQDVMERYDYTRQTEKFFQYCRAVYEARQGRTGIGRGPRP
jgi:glycosyltransferase involved in cell wall biosynthesis